MSADYVVPSPQLEEDKYYSIYHLRSGRWVAVSYLYRGEEEDGIHLFVSDESYPPEYVIAHEDLPLHQFWYDVGLNDERYQVAPHRQEPSVWMNNDAPPPSRLSNSGAYTWYSSGSGRHRRRRRRSRCRRRRTTSGQ